MVQANSGADRSAEKSPWYLRKVPFLNAFIAGIWVQTILFCGALGYFNYALMGVVIATVQLAVCFVDFSDEAKTTGEE